MNLLFAGVFLGPQNDATFEGSGLLGKVSSSHLNDNTYRKKFKARNLCFFLFRSEKVMLDIP